VAGEPDLIRPDKPERGKTGKRVLTSRNAVSDMSSPSAATRRVSTPAGMLRADGVAARLPKHVWQRLSAGAEAKGHRYYDWAFADIDLDEPHGCR